MTVTDEGIQNGGTVEIVCAPRLNRMPETITISAAWQEVAEKLVDVGTRRFRLPAASSKAGRAQREDTWWDIIWLWHAEVQQTTMPKRVAARLLGLSRQGFDDILNSGVCGPTPEPSALQVRRWAVEHDVDVPECGPIPRRVREAYDAAHGR